MMEPEVTGKQDWLSIETAHNGLELIPEDLVDLEGCAALIEALALIAMPAKAKEALQDLLYEEVKDYVSCRDSKGIVSAHVMRGYYGVRLILPGCLDRTEWDIYTNRKEAEREGRRLLKGE